MAIDGGPRSARAPGRASSGNASAVASLQQGSAPDLAPNPERTLRGTTALGDELRIQRERRGLALEQVCGTTRIRRCYLEALERNEWDAFPAPVFARSYLRTYAQAVGLDPERLLKAYDREQRIAGFDELPEGQQNEKDTKAVLTRLAKTQGGIEPARFGSKVKWIALGLAGGIAGAVAVWTVLNLRDPGPGERVAIDASSHERAGSLLPPPESETIRGEVSRDGRREVGRTSQPSAADTSGEPRPPAHPTADTSDAPWTRAGPAEPSSRDAHVADAPEFLATSPRSGPGAAPSPLDVVSASRLEVRESGLGASVVSQQLAGGGDSFEEGTLVSFWTRVLGGRRGDTIRHEWRHDGRVVGVAKLKVGGARWRARSRHRLPEGSSGSWTVVARDSLGNVLATAAFSCVRPRTGVPPDPGPVAPGS